MTAIVGLTGGIASGKSTVAGILRDEGIRVVDADQVAREVVQPNTPGLQAIVDAFGQDVLASDGSLDRKALGTVVFGDPDKRRVLEGITHPRIFARSMELLADIAGGQAPYGIYDAALLVENGSYKMLQALVVVAAPREIQRSRIVARDGLSHAEADARIDAQLPIDAKVAVADYVIQNDADLPTLRERTQHIHQLLSQRFGVSQ